MRKKIGDIGSSVEDLQKDGSRRRLVGNAVHREQERIEVDSDLDAEVDVRGTELGNTWSSRILERRQLSLNERRSRSYLGRCGVRLACALIPKNSQVGSTLIALRPDIRLRTDPVVSNFLVSIQDEGVALASEDVNLVGDDGLGGDTVGLDDLEVRVTVDLEDVISVAGHADETHAVTLSLLDGDDGQGSGGSTDVATSSVDESRVGVGDGHN